MKTLPLATAALAFSLIAAASCSKILEPLYVHLPGTEWTYEQDGMRAIIHFDMDGTSSVAQKVINGSATKQSNGTYVADGHSAIITATDGSVFKLVRTFSNLKTSKNKNMVRYELKDYESVARTVWAGVDRMDLHIYFFKDEKQLVKADYSVTAYEEGVALGWKKEIVPYTYGNCSFAAGEEKGYFFPDGMIAGSGRFWHMSAPLPQGTGTSDFEGTVWAFRSLSSHPGILIFNTGYSFIRAQVSSPGQLLFDQGTYTCDGNTVYMILNGRQDTCTISGKVFTFMEQSFEKLL